MYFQLKEKFLAERLAEKAKAGEEEKVSPEELSKFYKRFLDDNYKTHINYNKYVHAGISVWVIIVIPVIHAVTL